MRSFAAYCSRPQICDGLHAIGVTWVERAQFRFNSRPYIATYTLKFISERQPSSRDIVEFDLEDKGGNRVKIAGERLAAEPQRLQRDRSATSERINHK
jgi:hypothetical protein